MKITPHLNTLRFLGICLICASFSVVGSKAQSTRVESPTPIVSNEVSGKIAARDIGDARLTRYYYVFNGTQGDIFLKIQSSNFNGDIDVFYADSMRPLTKISLFADSAPTQTGREIYLRKPERLILRVEGRTPNDDPATFSIRFDGSFAAITDAPSSEDDLPKVKNEVQGAVRVNSVGTIIEPAAKPEEKKEVIAKSNDERSETVEKPANNSEAEAKESVAEKEEDSGRSRTAVNKTAPRNTGVRRRTAAKTPPPRRKTTPARTTAKRTPPAEPETETEAQKLAKALENINLVVLFKDGGKIERPLNEVLRFSVDKGILTIIAKNGAIGRHSMIDVAKVSIE